MKHPISSIGAVFAPPAAQWLGVIAVGLYGRLLTARLGQDGRRDYELKLGPRAIAITICFHFTCATFTLLENSPAEIAQSLSQFFVSA